MQISKAEVELMKRMVVIKTQAQQEAYSALIAIGEQIAAGTHVVVTEKAVRDAFHEGYRDCLTDLNSATASEPDSKLVLVPREPTEAMCTASALALDKEKQRLGLNVQNPKAFKPNAKHAIRYRAMIRAAQGKAE